MTDDERQLIQIFIASLRYMRINGEATELTDQCQFLDLDCIAMVAEDIQAIANNGDTPEHAALGRVADLTQAVLKTWAKPDPTAIHDWLVARSELIQLRMVS